MTGGDKAVARDHGRHLKEADHRFREILDDQKFGDYLAWRKNPPRSANVVQRMLSSAAYREVNFRTLVVPVAERGE